MKSRRTEDLLAAGKFGAQFFPLLAAVMSYSKDR